MSSQKVRVVVNCSVEERAYIKMVAARKHMTISEFLISKAKEELLPNQTSIEAHKEALNGGGTEHSSIVDFWKDMGIDKNAKS